MWGMETALSKVGSDSPMVLQLHTERIEDIAPFVYVGYARDSDERACFKSSPVDLSQKDALKLLAKLRLSPRRFRAHIRLQAYPASLHKSKGH
jgi:hypothetical protein